MIALIRIEIDEKHLAKDTNEIYERLQGYKSVLMPLPEKRHYSDEIADEKGNDMYMEGWNDCLKAITGE